jgi:molybdopterin-guanine dinucleotide biosynthesis protein A
MHTGGIILCGGKSRRMGRAKALLPFGDETLLERVVRRLREVVEPVVVVAAVGQDLPDLPTEVGIVRDEHPDRGPLEGIAAGLRALDGRAEAAYVTACDVPFLEPGFVRRMIELLGDFDIAVPKIDGIDQPLSAVYRLSVLPHAEALLAAERRRPVFLYEQVRARRLSDEELRDVDPELLSLANTNTPEDYQAALRRAGLAQIHPRRLEWY